MQRRSAQSLRADKTHIPSISHNGFTHSIPFDTTRYRTPGAFLRSQVCVAVLRALALPRHSGCRMHSRLSPRLPASASRSSGDEPVHAPWLALWRVHVPELERVPVPEREREPEPERVRQLVRGLRRGGGLSMVAARTAVAGRMVTSRHKCALRKYHRQSQRTNRRQPTRKSSRCRCNQSSLRKKYPCSWVGSCSCRSTRP